MSGKQREYRRKIKTVESLGKSFRAMELIAASKISNAKKAALSFEPYSSQISTIVKISASHMEKDIMHNLFREFPNINQSAILVLSADRGMAGAYNSSVLKSAYSLRQTQKEKSKNTLLFVSGTRGIQDFQYRGLNIEKSWSGSTDNPSFEIAVEISNELYSRFGKSVNQNGISEIFVVYTHFINLLRQEVKVVRLLPIELVVENEENGENVKLAESKPAKNSVNPLYEFEPSVSGVLDNLLPLYLQTRILNFLQHSAASEMASRQNAMHTANDNANDLIKKYTSISNVARQSEITQEISEIVSGANAL